MNPTKTRQGVMKRSPAAPLFRSRLLSRLAGLLTALLIVPSARPVTAQEAMANRSTIEPVVSTLTAVEKNLDKLSRRVSVELGDVPLRQALTHVSGLGDLQLVLDEEAVPNGHRVTLSLNEATVLEALHETIRGTNLGLKISPSGYLIVTRRMVIEPVPMSPTPLPAAPTGSIAGVVTDETGEPLPGVNVVITGTTQGASSDVDGRYLIENLEPGVYTLQASFIGYVTQTVEDVAVAEGRTTTVDLTLEPVTMGLDEVIVVGYGELRRRDLTGSVASVDASKLAEMPVTSVEQILQGRAAGVQVIRNSGAPGAAFTVRIRGGNSMRGGNDPLYVVDGFPLASIGGDGGSILSMLDANEIESIDVLKDASATAIYGARGANGVVIITTKKGRSGSRLDFESFYGVQQVPKTIPLANARQYAEMANDWTRNQNIAKLPFPDLDNLPYDTDWQDEVFQTSPIQSYSLSFSGGGNQTRYLLSGNWLDQQGVIESSDFSRGTLRANIDSDINTRFSVSNQLMLARAVTNEVPVSLIEHIFTAPPTIPVYDENGNYYNYSDYPWWGAYPRSPVADMNEVTDRNKQTRILESFTAKYRLLDGLTASALFGADYRALNSEYYATRLHESGGTGGLGRAGKAETLTYLNENTLNYVPDLGPDNRLNATVGFTWQRSSESGLTAEASGFVNDILQQYVLGSGESIAPPVTNITEWSLQSWLGRVNYTFKDRYLLTVSGRADGSSRFGSGNKWAFFPSAALAWRINQESFLAGAESLSDLKLRLSWGRTGNQEIGVYNSLQRIAPLLFVDGDNLGTGFAPVNVSNPDLRWETTDQYSAGLDLGFYDQRLTMTLDAYIKNTSDLLALVNLPPSSGFSTMLRNVGSIRNAGVEFSIGATPIQRERFEWSLDANISANRNEVTELAQGNEFIAPDVTLHGPVHLIREGEPMSVFYGFVEKGLNAQGYTDYVDQNGDNVITDADRIILGSPYPDFVFGFNTSLRYGRLDLSATLQGVVGNEIYNGALGFTAASFAKGYNQLADVYGNYWTPDNPDPNAKYPRLSSTNYFRPSARFLEDGSYLRLTNVRLGYHLPPALTGWAGARDVLVYLSGQNLLTLTGYSWYDPEISRFGGGDLRIGVDSFTYPQVRTLTFGVRLGF